MATFSVEFSFNNVMYRLFDGVAIGSPLGPAIAKTFVGYYKDKLFKRVSKLFMYHRYVDDAFIVFNNKKECSEFLTQRNSQNHFLYSTFEKESKLFRTLQDVIKKSDSCFITSGYRKPTFTGEHVAVSNPVFMLTVFLI